MRISSLLPNGTDFDWLILLERYLFQQYYLFTFLRFTGDETLNILILINWRATTIIRRLLMKTFRGS